MLRDVWMGQDARSGISGSATTVRRKREVGHLWYMRTVKDAFPATSDKALYVSYDFETTQNTVYTAEGKLHVPIIVCVQQFCSRCEDVEDEEDCVRCGKRKHSF